MPDTNPPAASVALLEPFIGIWDTTGTLLGTDGKPEGELKATDGYEWFPGRHFILHHVKGTMSGQDVRTLEVIGAGDASGCVTRAYDSSGQTDEYRCALDGHDWAIDGETQRFRGKFDDGFGVLEGDWELAEDDGKSWRRWMHIRLVKRM
jgi:hypothetical protein